MAATPTRRLVRARVACALRSGLDGAERPAVERWLGGLRRLDALIVPFASPAPRCPGCGERLARVAGGWRCPSGEAWL
jgi:hypothetical protein